MEKLTETSSITRRSFLAAGAALASTAVFSPYVIGNSRPKERLGVALVGLGYYSTDLLAPALQLTKNCYLAGIVTGTPAKAETWKKKYNIPDKNIYSYDTFDQIANNPDIDVVYVVLPPSMHREYVVRAAKAGKHVWCEKPMAPTVKDCEAMIKACADNKQSLAIGYRCQHDPNTQAFMKLAKEKTLGKVKLITCAAGYNEGRVGHWKLNKALGGGVMGDMGVYAIQGARLAAGEEPMLVTAQHINNRPELFKEVDETTLYQFHFPSGAIANCTSSFGINTNFLKVNYEKGFLHMDPFSAYKGNKGTYTNGEINFPLDNQQAKQMDEDATSIMQKQPMLAPGEEGMRDIRIVESIYEAARTGKAVKI
ncbi:Gfo/Idh/MocA family protein [Arundinibacter roseus]|uniref:Gfo/Idh/MocA family oxidoreductase n=1 Tax=Arundinibacter roseus TaxID=2070510 RepID=A0A4R4K3A4_9BACT|nr:Gfo/Idh/MocA family oxidoreductase [Arundinibacter roseus]TDB61864.1 Gfo/Idh/MocA family oxidoreductase [Arundinibacter roseus]